MDLECFLLFPKNKNKKKKLFQKILNEMQGNDKNQEAKGKYIENVKICLKKI